MRKNRVSPTNKCRINSFGGILECVQRVKCCLRANPFHIQSRCLTMAVVCWKPIHLWMSNAISNATLCADNFIKQSWLFWKSECFLHLSGRFSLDSLIHSCPFSFNLSLFLLHIIISLKTPLLRIYLSSHHRNNVWNRFNCIRSTVCCRFQEHIKSRNNVLCRANCFDAAWCTVHTQYNEIMVTSSTYACLSVMAF